MTRHAKLALLGFGEAAQAFLKGWRSAPGFDAEVVAYDVKTDADDPAVREAKRADYVSWGVEGAQSAAEAVSEASLVFSVVTADRAHEAAVAALPGLRRGALFFDCDSCAPQTKQRSAREVEAAGGRYVDVAVMAPVHPRLHQTPLLIGGPHAQAGAEALRALDMRLEIHDGPVGAASAVKMVRSVMIKGIEALVCECVLTGERAGVTEAVLATLEDTFPGFDWPARSAYMLERVMTHGVRRAAEMREVAVTVDAFGLDGDMSRACVEWQQRVGELGLKAREIGLGDYRALARAILDKLPERPL